MIKRPADLSCIVKKTCTDKIQLSLEQANRYVDTNSEKGIIFYFYKCKFCMRYHISKHSEAKNYVVVIGGNQK